MTSTRWSGRVRTASGLRTRGPASILSAPTSAGSPARGVEQCLELPGTQAYPTVAGGSSSSVVSSQANLTSISSRIRSARIGCFSHLDAESRTLKRRGRSSGRQTPDRLGFRRRCTTQRVRRRRHSAAGQHVLVRRIPAADRPVSGVQRDEGRGGRAGALQPRKRPSMKR